jgi:hypothetical protein
MLKAASPLIMISIPFVSKAATRMVAVLLHQFFYRCIRYSGLGVRLMKRLAH